MSQDNYYLLKEEIAIKAGDYLFNDNQVFKNEYESLYSFILNNFNDCSLDLRENNSLYLNSYSLLNSSSNSIRGANFIELNISFVFSFLFIYLLTFLLNKKHKSLGLVAMKLTYDFSQKPSKNEVPEGFAYFCIDKQTTEGQSNGIMIYHKGSNVWVDALGRIIS